jgi:hypothetical protein
MGLGALASRLPYIGCAEKEDAVKISTQENDGRLTLKVEGKIIGDWAEELERFWHSFHALLGAKKLCLDICGVAYVDHRGKQVLQRIFAATGAEILADSPLTKQFANEAKQVPSEDGTGD